MRQVIALPFILVFLVACKGSGIVPSVQPKTPEEFVEYAIYETKTATATVKQLHSAGVIDDAQKDDAKEILQRSVSAIKAATAAINLGDDIETKTALELSNEIILELRRWVQQYE